MLPKYAETWDVTYVVNRVAGSRVKAEGSYKMTVKMYGTTAKIRTVWLPNINHTGYGYVILTGANLTRKGTTKIRTVWLPNKNHTVYGYVILIGENVTRKGTNLLKLVADTAKY
jgi:hypothetical protein